MIVAAIDRRARGGDTASHFFLNVRYGTTRLHCLDQAIVDHVGPRRCLNPGSHRERSTTTWRGQEIDGDDVLATTTDEGERAVSRPTG